MQVQEGVPALGSRERFRKVILATVGFNYSRPWRAVASIGLEPGSLVIIVNSEPRTREAVDAVEKLKNMIIDAYGDLHVETRDVWLDPSNGIPRGVAKMRRVVEEAAPASAYILASGGLRWLVVSALLTAMALQTVGVFRGIKVEMLRVDLESEAEGIDLNIRPEMLQPLQLESVPPLATIDYKELLVVETLAGLGRARVKSIARSLQVSRTLADRLLRKLESKKLISSEVRGRGKLYSLTDLGYMLVGI